MKSKEGLIVKLGQFIKYYIKTFFMGKYVENVQHKLVLDLYLVLENYVKYSQCMQETLLQLSYSEKGSSKKTCFQTQPVFMNIIRISTIIYQSLFRLPIMFTRFLSLPIHRLTKFYVLLQIVF